MEETGFTDICFMNLNHLNLSVPDVPAAKVFFETHFQFQSEDSKPNDTLSVLTGENGFILVLMHERLNEKGNTAYPDAFHIGFYLDNEEQVNAKYEHLKSGGIAVDGEPRKIRKTYGFYFYFQNMMIEVTSHIIS